MIFKRRFFNLIVILLVLILTFFVAEWSVKKLYPLEHENYIKMYSKEYSLDPYLVMAIIKTESNYESSAKSHKSANGLMQITDETGKWIAEKMKIENFDSQQLYNPEVNIKMGCWYLDNLRKEFGSNVELVLSAYNAGRGNVKNWLNDKKYSKDGKVLDYIPFEETDKYIKKVKTSYNVYKFIYGNELDTQQITGT